MKLFIRVPASCRSSIVALEGDYRGFNDFKYIPKERSENSQETWEYRQNSSILNFDKKINLNRDSFKPISKLQLLTLNTGESYPFADRLVEYLSNSAITPIDEIPDNIKRVQKVMEQNKHYFKINGLWEDKMQKIIYDYIMNAGPIEIKEGKLRDRHSGHNPKYHGYQPKLGHNSKSNLYDVLGYVDRDAEKWYASWTKDSEGKVKLKDNIQNVDIYIDKNGKSLWDL